MHIYQLFAHRMSSLEDEIMEIIDLSSLDNDLCILSKTTSNTIVAKISSASVSKENQRYKSKFKKNMVIQFLFFYIFT